jgi:hypothetical protein
LNILLKFVYKSTSGKLSEACSLPDKMLNIW